MKRYLEENIKASLQPLEKVVNLVIFLLFVYGLNSREASSKRNLQRSFSGC
jgi:hypothetical protein